HFPWPRRRPLLGSGMARVATRFLIFSTFSALLALHPVTSAQQATFRTGTELVTFGVTVTDRRGNFITDLTADDFEVLEDHRPQSLKYFTRGTEPGEGVELHVGLLFDTSGSMGEDINLAR